MSAQNDEFLRRLEELRGEIESWLRKEDVPSSELSELAQATIFRAAEKRHTYDPMKPLAPWLRGVALSVAVTYHRRANVRAKHAFRLLMDEWDESTPERDSIERELYRALSDAVAELDVEARTVIEKFYGDGKSLEQISAEMGLSVRTLKRRLADSRDAVRRALAARGITDARRGLLLPFALFRAVYERGTGQGTPNASESFELHAPAPQAQRSERAPQHDPASSDALSGSTIVESPPRRQRITATLPIRRLGALNSLVSVAFGVVIGMVLVPLSTCQVAGKHPVAVELRIGGRAQLAALATKLGTHEPAPACVCPAAPVPPPMKPPRPPAGGPQRQADDEHEAVEEVVSQAGRHHDLGRQVSPF